MTIKKDTLHPENEPEVDIYPKTSIDQVENLQANLDALNGDIANVNGEIANISTNVENIANKVGDINKDVSTLKYNDTNQDRRIQVLENTSGTTINRVEIAENNITDLQNDVNQNIIDISDIKDDITVLNGDIANVNGEIANISTNVENIANKVGDINKDVSTLKYNDTNQDRRIQVLENTSGTTINRVEIAENNITDLQNDVNQNIIDISDIKDDITVLNTAYGSYTDYTEVTNGFLLTYLSGKQIELPIKAGTNVTFSKYPGSNQIIINSTGRSVPDNITFPNKTGTIALTTDIPNYTSVAGVLYDTTNGAIIAYKSGKIITIPIKAGDGVTIDADTTDQNILISAPGGGSSTPQYNRGMGSATPTTFTYELGVYHTLTITLLSTYVSTTIILPNDYDGSRIDIELEGKSFIIMIVAGLLSVRNTTDNTVWVGKLE